MKRINEGTSLDANNGLSRRDFFGTLGVIALTFVAVDKISKSDPDKQDAVETIYDMKRGYNELNMNFENFFLLAYLDKSAQWKQEGNMKTLIHQGYKLSIEGSTMFLTIQDSHGDSMNITYVMESGHFSINRENVDRDIIHTIDRAMGELQLLFH